MAHLIKPPPTMSIVPLEQNEITGPVLSAQTLRSNECYFFLQLPAPPLAKKFQHPHLLVPLLSTPATVLLNLSFSVRQPLFHGGSGSRFKLRQHSLRTPFSSGPHQLPSSSQRQLIMVGSLTINYSTSREADAQSVVDDTLFKGIGVPSENG
uniref:Uncharacterized protein n=1 Tax=Cucumis sativus TaxID=3659 RepID=A0A0A0K6C9_CUCSA